MPRDSYNALQINKFNMESASIRCMECYTELQNTYGNFGGDGGVKSEVSKGNKMQKILIMHIQKPVKYILITTPVLYFQLYFYSDLNVCVCIYTLTQICI